MARRKNATSATLIQTLVFYDGPQLALFETSAGLKMLAAAIGEPGEQNLFFGSELPDKIFRAYKNGRVDLNFVFRYATGRRLFVFDWSSMDKENTVLIRHATIAERETNENYPERGFFETDHTEKWEMDNVPVDRKKYEIDGNWDAADFSKFYNKIGDIYAFLSVVEDIESDDIGFEEKRDILDALTEPTWRGGGSYTGFYADLTSHAQSIRPLRVSGIQYHSPGHIEVEGRSTVFTEIGDAVVRFNSNDETIRKYASAINKILDNESLKRANKDTEFSSKAVEGYVFNTSKSLAASLGLPNIESLFISCNRNTLVFSKVILSYFRRVRDLCSFQREGRVTFEPPTASSASTGAKPDV